MAISIFCLYINKIGPYELKEPYSEIADSSLVFPGKNLEKQKQRIILLTYYMLYFNICAVSI
jgi:hypothetical protein